MVKSFESIVSNFTIKLERKIINHPKVLIIIPTEGKRIQFLYKAVDSVFNQTFRPSIAVAAKKESRVNLMELEKKYKPLGIKFFYEEGKLADVVNKILFSDVEHEYSNWIGDDDVLNLDCIENVTKEINKDNQYVLYFGGCYYIDFSGSIIGKYNPSKFSGKMIGFVPAAIKLEGGLFRIDAFKQVGGLNNSLKFTPDVELVLKLRNVGKFKKVNSFLSYFRLHDNSPTTSRKLEQLNEAKELQKIYAKKYEKFLLHWLGPIIRYSIYIYFNYLMKKKI